MVRQVRRGAHIAILFTILFALPSWLSAAPPDGESIKERKEQQRKEPPAPTPTRSQQAPPGGTSTTQSSLTGTAVDKVLIPSGGSWATVSPNARGEYETLSLQRGVRIEFRVPFPSTIEVDIDGGMLVKDQSPGYYANITNDAFSTGVANWVMNVVLPPAKLTASQIEIGIKYQSPQGSTRSVVKLVQRQPVKPVVDKVLILSGGSFTTVSPNARGEYEILPLQTGVRIEFHVPFPSTIGVDVDRVALAKDQSPGYYANITNDVTRTWWANWVVNVVPPPAKLTASQLEIGISASTAGGSAGGASSGPPRSAIKLVQKPQAQRPPSGTTATAGSSCPTAPLIQGYRHVGTPGCATNNIADHPGAYRDCDGQSGYYCCEPAKGANSKCGRDKYSFPCDCMEYGIDAELKADNQGRVVGCYKLVKSGR